MRWVFHCARPLVPATGDPHEAGLGGTEQAIIQLTTALARRGHEVAVAGGVAASRRIGDIDWFGPDHHPAPDSRPSIDVAINDATLLPAGAKVPVIWFHNEVELLREVRKGRLAALWRHRPAAVFIGREQARLASRLLPFRVRATIPYGLADRILAAPPGHAPPPPVALFTSQAYRGLDRVIGMWKRHVANEVPTARLEAYIATGDVARFAALAQGCPAISIRSRVSNTAMLDLLRGARLLLAPGHRSETFCMAAAEAIAMGVPVVTLGIGSLKERVRGGVDGFVCRNWQAMAQRSRAILTDDAQWHRLHEAGLATRTGAGWDRAAADWEMFASRLLDPARLH